MSIKTGATVRLIQPVIQGVVKSRRISPVTDELELLVEWVENGELVSRWLDADLVEEAPARGEEGSK